MEDNGYHRFLVDDMPGNTIASSESVSPGSAVGYETFIGRYFDCGRYGLSVSSLNFNPGQEESVYTAPADNAYRASMPQYENLMVDHDGDAMTDPESVYHIYDAADTYRIRRNVGIQGLEVSLSTFGIMGARRLAPLCGSGFGYGPISRMKQALGLGRFGYTGAGGALESPCAGCSQVVMSHGFRWLQFNDEFAFSSMDGSYMARAVDDPAPDGPVDMFHDIDVENNLYGYQFGGRLTYCLTPRLVANIGGKAGIYGNDVDVQQRIGTFTDDAYVTGDVTQVINTSSSDVVLSGLGEVDLGLGYRLNNCWTINGGYRALYATGVATSIGSIANDYASINSMPKIYADDSLLLHGAYFGASMNW